MRPYSLILLLGLISTCALAWDPEDETFDPSIFETIIDGNSRIGDPSPVYPKGSLVRGFTYVKGSKAPEGGVNVMISLILTPDPAKPQAFLPGSAYLNGAEATKLAGWLRGGSEAREDRGHPRSSEHGQMDGPARGGIRHHPDQQERERVRRICPVDTGGEKTRRCR